MRRWKFIAGFGGAALILQLNQAESREILAFGILGVCLALTAGLELVASGLNRRRYWAWIVGICVFAVFIPSGFLPIGLVGIWALLNRETQATFGIRVAARRSQ